MRKLFALLIVLGALVIPSVVQAQAIIVRVPDTTLPGVDAAGNLDFGLFGPARCQDVQNANWFILSCLGEVTNNSGTAAKFTETTDPGVTCNAAFGQGFVPADTWHYTVSASGQSALSCKFRK